MIEQILHFDNTRPPLKINTNLVWTSYNTGVLNLTPEFLQFYKLFVLCMYSYF